MNPLVHAAIYARVSTSEQSVEMQLEPVRGALRAWARSHGRDLDDVELFVETGSSGPKQSLPIRAHLVHRLRDREGRSPIEVVGVWKLDRLGRSTREVLEIVDELRELDVVLVSATEGLDTRTHLGRFVLEILASLAAFERELIRERVRAGIAAARRRGVRLGRPPTSLFRLEVLEELGRVDADVEAVTISRTKALSKVARRLGTSLRSLTRWAAAQNPPVELPRSTPRNTTSRWSGTKGGRT